jgi:hypothetical protein
MKETKQNLNHMHFACILATFRTTQMKAKLITMQVEYREDGTF